MQNLFNMSKSFFDAITKANEQALEQFKSATKTMGTVVKPEDVQKTITEATASAKATFQQSAEQVIAFQKSAHDEVIKQLEKYKTDATSAFVDNYKKAVATYDTLAKEAIEKLSI